METTPQIKSHLSANSNMSKKDIIVSNFLGGLSWGLGSVIGATIVVAIVIKVLGIINFVPLIGNFTGQIIQQAQIKQLQSK